MKKSSITDIFALIVVVGGILVLVRPGSQGPGLVSAFGNAFSGALAVATGGQYASNGGAGGNTGGGSGGFGTQGIKWAGA